MENRRVKFVVACLVFAGTLHAATAPEAKPGDFVIKDFHFTSGGTLPELRIHYRTLGTPRRDASGRVTNAVLVLHGTSGSGENFLADAFAGVLFVPGGLLDARKYFIVLPDGIGHGHSSKPSDGLRAHFPRYGYDDMVTAQYRLLTEGLGVNHLRLVMGTSMGGMHSWLWAEKYPEFMDAAMPLASLPIQISGRNRQWRKMVIDQIRGDPGYNHGDYTAQPYSLIAWVHMLWLMSNNPVQRQKDAPTREKADAALDRYVEARMKGLDANDIVYNLDASYDYDPEARLGGIKTTLLAINTADDLINPPELGVLEREIKKVPHGRAIVIPLSVETRGHGTHTLAAVWQQYLAELLEKTQKQ